MSIHERSLAYMILIPAALVCPKKCGAVAEDASIIASHIPLAILTLLTKKRDVSFFCTVRKQTCQKTKLFKCEAISFPSLGSKSFLDTVCRAQACADCKRIWANVFLRKGKELNLQNM